MAWRFIPTRVGNTSSVERMRHEATVHPHAGGEHARSASVVALANGSSPRGWGTPVGIVYFVSVSRFIPTRVGNTRQGHDCPCYCAVHPHAGGEHLAVLMPYCATGGSSPRGWGTRDDARLACLDGRFIPTRVGNTIFAVGHDTFASVHPHAGGEHGRFRLVPSAHIGSSPRGWGTRLWDNLI